jgi:hypothetical protein
MTHEELIAKARAHMEPFDRRKWFGANSDVFTDARVVETALVYLGNQHRSDYIEVYLNRENGEFITATYRPGPGADAAGSVKGAEIHPAGSECAAL